MVHLDNIWITVASTDTAATIHMVPVPLDEIQRL